MRQRNGAECGHLCSYFHTVKDLEKILRKLDEQRCLNQKKKVKMISSIVKHIFFYKNQYPSTNFTVKRVLSLASATIIVCMNQFELSTADYFDGGAYYHHIRL